ncbi:glycosyltransferase family 2 protein [Vibrio fluvialis]|uniref:glycosyltransferase family 2 protein n=1 Tax=Vibrio TaxID=662 RepID=UPI0013030F28|nr:MULTISPECIES: glycosyltransferase family 2 protein [Vibrio]EMC0409085.1 glycosyltransferase family 2 protein [Vibrio fluvialis]MBY8035684.1 glycosyltransferase family 2 protein [Vibrio fluvialis]MBY8039694.1 glycosyltransferase family 2 protein [Vibrio fluvialis]MBY8194706.1 glycosyltransferase family 2 protein [Vibrio fluvialis]MCE7616718.1 glycosyltransferase family 2 protein [Vibrio fluvialis]
MIMIPMAGMSSRFFKAGYSKPKYMLEAKGKTLFEHSVLSFEKYFKDELFVFVIRDVYETKKFVIDQVKKLGIKDFKIVCLDVETKGQAETVFLGLDGIDDNESLTIFNIDTFRPEFSYPDLSSKEDGYLEVFQGSGDNWSFVLPENEESTLLVETAEKRPISDLCCTGLYYFNKVSDFKLSYNDYLNKPKELWEKGELYVAPLYNFLIKNGKSIHYHKIERDEVIFCGTPDEYDDFLR